MAAVAVKRFIRKARQNAASWLLVIFFWHVIDDQSKVYRKTGHGENLFVKQHKYQPLA